MEQLAYDLHNYVGMQPVLIMPEKFIIFCQEKFPFKQKVLIN